MTRLEFEHKPFRIESERSSIALPIEKHLIKDNSKINTVMKRETSGLCSKY